MYQPSPSNLELDMADSFFLHISWCVVADQNSKIFELSAIIKLKTNKTHLSVAVRYIIMESSGQAVTRSSTPQLLKSSDFHNLLNVDTRQ